jgi:hypothetical protein
VVGVVARANVAEPSVAAQRSAAPEKAAPRKVAASVVARNVAALSVAEPREAAENAAPRRAEHAAAEPSEAEQKKAAVNATEFDSHPYTVFIARESRGNSRGFAFALYRTRCPMRLAQSAPSHGSEKKTVLAHFFPLTAPKHLP